MSINLTSFTKTVIMTETVSGGFAMKTLGLDIGTTSISSVVFEAETGVLAARTVKNDSFFHFISSLRQIINSLYYII